MNDHILNVCNATNLKISAWKFQMACWWYSKLWGSTSDWRWSKNGRINPFTSSFFLKSCCNGRQTYSSTTSKLCSCFVGKFFDHKLTVLYFLNLELMLIVINLISAYTVPHFIGRSYQNFGGKRATFPITWFKGWWDSRAEPVSWKT